MTPPGRMIPLDQIRFGHEAEPPINARRTGRTDDIDALAASIAAHGQIHALAVRTIDGIAYVADGNRRLAALHLRAERGEITAKEPIRCDEVSEDAAADELSVAANLLRAPLHEADAYETFRDLAARGMSETEIAARFGIEAKRVTRMLALGRLSPVILKAWREDEFGRDAGKCVRAFTLAASIEEQERVFHDLQKNDRLTSDWLIRQAFGAGDREAARLFNFVGEDAYLEAGGAVTVDLFGEDHAISDPALVAKLAADKIEAKLAELVADGWAWAARAEDLPYSWTYSWQKLQISKKKATAEQKATSGCVLALDHLGALNIAYGVLRPAQAKKEAAAKAGEPGEEKEAAISNAMAHRLSVRATLAVREALAQEPRLGLVALLAGFLCGGSYGTPIRVRHEGFDHRESREVEPFPVAFERLASMSDAELFSIAAGFASATIDMQVHNSHNLPFGGANGALADAIDSGTMYVALRDKFDAEDYFGGVSKPLVLKAIGETLGEDQARGAGKLKKKELVEFALKNVPPTGWLPPELRTSHYPGPGAEAGMQEAAE